MKSSPPLFADSLKPVEHIVHQDGIARAIKWPKGEMDRHQEDPQNETGIHIHILYISSHGKQADAAPPAWISRLSCRMARSHQLASKASRLWRYRH